METGYDPAKLEYRAGCQGSVFADTDGFVIEFMNSALRVLSSKRGLPMWTGPCVEIYSTPKTFLLRYK